MNDPQLDLLIKKKMQQYVPERPIQIMHGGVIVLASIAIGVLSLPPGPTSADLGSPNGVAGLGVYLAVTGLALYLIWTYLRTARARKEAEEEFRNTSTQTPD